MTALSKAERLKVAMAERKEAYVAWVKAERAWVKAYRAWDKDGRARAKANHRIRAIEAEP